MAIVCAWNYFQKRYSNMSLDPLNFYLCMSCHILFCKVQIDPLQVLDILRTIWFKKRKQSQSVSSQCTYLKPLISIKQLQDKNYLIINALIYPRYSTSMVGKGALSMRLIYEFVASFSSFNFFCSFHLTKL